MITRINVGPIHPGTHGVLRLLVDVDGDTIKRVETHIGFLHRGVEKLVETRMYMQSPPYMEKLDYIAPLAFDELLVAAIEGALGVEVKERAQYIRVIQLELQRIASHLLWLGTLANDVGQLATVFMWAFSDRDKVMRLLEESSGTRMFYVNQRIGGLIRDQPPDFKEHALPLLDYLEKRIPEFEATLEKNPIFTQRMKGIGVLGKEDAINFGVTGPVLRGSGINYDTRSNQDYYVYKKLNFAPQIQYRGDSYSRYKVRMLELRESIKVVRNALNKMPEGDALGLPVRLINPAVKNRIVRVSRETPRGEGMMYMVADPQRPYRLSIRSPSFVNLSVLDHISREHRFADLFAILASLDPVMADVDR